AIHLPTTFIRKTDRAYSTNSRNSSLAIWSLVSTAWRPKQARSAGYALPVGASTTATRWLACKEHTSTSRRKEALRSNSGRRIRWKRLGPSLEGLPMILIIFSVLYLETPNWLSSIGRMGNHHAFAWNRSSSAYCQ